MKHNPIILPPNAESIIQRLNENGYSAYVVGGCVRDSLLGRKPGDWDITTSATPAQIKQIFTKTVDTGLKHGTVTVLLDRVPYEVTTYRIDGEYIDYRRPESVEYTSDLLEDLKRRDFTMNAMAYHPKEGLIDAFNGMQDLQKRIIRCVGVAHQRFKEDALRMLRAVRFSAQLNFTIEQETKQAIIDMAPLIKNVSAERIQVELTKILLSNNPEKLITLHELGLMTFVLPEFIPCIHNEQKHPYHAYPIDRHIIKSVRLIESNPHLRWTMLLHDIGKPKTKRTDEEGITHFHGHQEVSADIAKQVLRRLKFDNATIQTVVKLVTYHDYRFKVHPKNVRKAIYKVGEALFEDYLKVQSADIRAQHPNLIEERIIKINTIREMAEMIKKENECVSLKQLAVNGHDLIQIGIVEGKRIGEILKQLLDLVIEDPEKNTRTILLKYIHDNLQ